MTNWVETANPFGLPKPPEWFLRALAVEHPALVLFPSCQEPVYRLVVRARRGPGFRPRPRVPGLRWRDYLAQRPDYVTLAELRAYPVFSVLPASLGTDWARVLAELPEHDLHRVVRRPDDPTDDTASRLLEAHEAAQAAAARRREDDELTERARDGYRTLQLIAGSRTGPGGASGLGDRQFRRAAPRPVARRPVGGSPGWYGGRDSLQGAAARA